MNAKNDSTNNINRYFYVFLTEYRNIGDKSNHTPQHITLVPPFSCDERNAIEVAEIVSSKFKPFSIELNGRSMIGDKKNISVVLVKPNIELLAVHVSLLDELERRSIDTGYTRFVREEFTPHITIKKYLPDIAENKMMIFNHIAVINKCKTTKTVSTICKLGK